MHSVQPLGHASQGAITIKRVYRDKLVEMSKMKEIMIKGMSKVMLDCDHATYLLTQSEYEKLHCVKRVQLKMHLASCKLCRAFAKQSKIITGQLDSLKEIDEDNLSLHLSNQQKEELQETIETNIKSN